MSLSKTPLRYPGGKQKLAPFILEVMLKNDLVGADYVEPYAGGAGAAIELLLSGKVSHIHLNDASKGIYAFWRSILTKTEEFCRHISSASLTVDEWRRQREIFSRPSEFDQLSVGFSFFYLNRCNRSGIPTAGLIGGIKQNGKWLMDARFPRNELIRRIELIASKKNNITVKNCDAEEFIKYYVRYLPEKTIVYCDPPYFNKADRLYFDHYSPKDHARIAKVIQKNITHSWLISYDSVPEILKFYSERKCFVYDLQYNAAKAYKGKEVFIFSDDLKLPDTSTISYIDSALRELKIA
jgi:DNA adenine methylase